MKLMFGIILFLNFLVFTRSSAHADEIFLNHPISATQAGSTVTQYSLNLTAGQGVTVALTSRLQAGYVSFQLLDANNVVLGSSSDGTLYNGETGYLNRSVQKSGTYTVKVTGSTGAAGECDLAAYGAWFNAAVSDDQRNFFSTDYTSRYAVNGNYSVPSLNLKRGFYRFTAQQHSQVSVSLTAHLQSGALNYALYDKNLVALASSNDGSITNGQTGTLSKTIERSGVYYIWVTGTSDAVGSYDLAVSGSDADQDSDNDGLFDAAEYYHGTSVNSVDSDGDGANDLEEVAQGRNPRVATEYLSSAVAGATSKATAVALTVFDRSVSVQRPMSDTWYAVNLVAGQGVTVALTAHLQSGWLRFYLYDSDNVLLGSSSDSYSAVDNGETGIISTTLFQSGVYYIKVIGSSDAVGSYDLAAYNAWFNGGVTDGQRSFFATSNTSRYAVNGSYAFTSLNLKTEYYRFTAQQHSQVSVALTAHLQSGSLNFVLYDRDLVQLASSNDSAITSGQTGTLNKAIERSGFFYIRVTGTSDAVGSYDLAVSGAEADGDSDNDGLLDAAEYYHGTNVNNADSDGAGGSDLDELLQGKNPLVASEYTASAVAGATGQATAVTLPFHDKPISVQRPMSDTWYAVNLVAGQGVTVALTAHLQSGYLRFYLYDSNNVLLGSSSDLYSAVDNGETGIISTTLFQGGVYYIKVIGSSDAVGSYDLAAYNAWFNGGVTDGQRSFFATSNTSRYAVNGSYAFTSLNLKTEYYRFTAQQHSQVSVALTAHLQSGSLNFVLYDRDLVQLASSNDSAITSGQTGTLNKAIERSGFFYIRVTGTSDAVGSYDLAVGGAEADSDSDNDGLFDAAEYYHGTNVSNADSDGAGGSDLDELLQGKNPLVASEYPASAVAGATGQSTAVALPFLDKPISVQRPMSDTWYAVNLVAGQGVTVALTAHLQSGWLKFYLYDSNNVLLGSSNDLYSGLDNGATGLINNTVFQGGVYYIKVVGSSDTVGAYDLAVYNAWFNPGVTDGQRSFYSTNYTSKYLQNGNHPVDPLGTVHRFTVQENVPLTVTFAPHLTNGSLGISLYDAALTDLGGRDGYVYDGETHVINMTIRKGGVYYVWVWGPAPGFYDLTVTGADADWDSDGDGLFDAAEYYHGTNLNNPDTDDDGTSDYGELLLGRPPLVATEYAASAVSGATTRATAVAVPHLDKKFHADHSGTDTWYAVNLAAGQGITVVFSPHIEYRSLGCSIYNSSGTDLGGGDTSVYSGETLKIDKTVAVAGTYYIRIWGSAPGDYDLAVYNAWFNPGVKDEQRSFYSTDYTPRHFQSGNYPVDPLGTVYRITVQENVPLAVTFAPHLNSGSLGISLYDATWTDLGGSDGYVYDGETHVISKTIRKGGVYYLWVWGAAPGSYDLTVTGADADLDSDSDGLFDAAEHYHGTDLNNPDTDGDGTSDYSELLQGRPPLVATEYAASAVSGATTRATAVTVPHLDKKFHADHPGTDTWYAVNLTTGQGVTVVFSPRLQYGSLGCSIYNSSGTDLGGGDTSVYSDETLKIDKTVAVAGTYYIRIWGSAPGDYDLAVYNAWFNPGVKDEQRSFYSTDYTPRHLQSGNYPVDPLGTVYRITVQENVPLAVTFAPHLNSGSLGISLYDATWTDLGGSDGYVYDGETHVISKTIRKGGVYYLWVWGAALGSYDLTVTGADADRDSDGDGLFDAAEYYHGTDLNNLDTDGDGTSDNSELLQGRPPLVATEYTASVVSGATTRATAVTVPHLDKKFHADHPGTDTWYAVNLAAGQGVTVVFSPRLQYGSLGCSIYNSSGTDLGGGDTSVYSGETLKIDKTVAVAGTYYIRIWGSAPGDYDLAVYSAWFNPGVTDGQRDFYSTYNTARYLVNDRYAVNPLGQVYRLELTAGQGISLSFSPHIQYESLGCAMYDASGADLGGGDGYVYDGETLKLDKAVVKSGIYYVKVWGSAPGSYDLAISGAVIPTPSRKMTLYLGGTGQGTINGSNIICSGTICVGTYDQGTQVSLTAEPSSDSQFDGWYGSGCSGTGTCSVSMDVDRAVTAWFRYTGDVTPPDTAIESHPPAVTNDPAASFSFYSSEAGSTLECLTETGYFDVCSSPLVFSVADGPHTFQVRSTDAAGNVDPTPATYSWTVDTVAPETTIQTRPALVEITSSASFTFASSESDSTFLCSVDSASFAPCVSPASFDAGANGSHTFQVRAVDAAGNVDVSPASATWEVAAPAAGAGPRFADLGDGTLVDTVSDLRWLKDASCFTATYDCYYASPDESSWVCNQLNSPIDWYQANLNTDALANGQCGLGDGSVPGDWHLPTLEELRTVSVAGFRADTLNAAGFKNVVADGYWTTSIDETSNLPSVVSMSDGSQTPGLLEHYYAWPVRSASQVAWNVGSFTIYADPAFGIHRVGEATSRQVTVMNSGATSQSITALSITDVEPTQFGVATGGNNPCPSLSPNLAAGGSCTVNLTFIPSSNGPKSASLTVVANGQTLDIPVSGIGITTIAGKVTDLSTGYPLAAATVTLTGDATIQTDPRGKFVFDPRPADGVYSVTISQAGYGTIVINNVVVSDTAGANLKIGMTPEGPLAIITQSPILPGATIGAAYHARINISGGTGPFTFSIPGGMGSLPPGLTLDSDLGRISGTPSSLGSYTFSIKVTDSLGEQAENQDYVIDVAVPIVISTASPLPRVTKNVAYALQIAVSGGAAPYQFSLGGGVPHGLAIDPATGLISGTAQDWSSEECDGWKYRCKFYSVSTGNLIYTDYWYDHSPACDYLGGWPDKSKWYPVVENACALPRTQSNVVAPGNYDFIVNVSDSHGRITAKDFSVDVDDQVDTGPPDTVLTGLPSAISTTSSAIFSFSSSEANSTFSCSLDGGGQYPCFSPHTVSPLASGGHTFTVTAVDRAGNADPAPATFRWEVALPSAEQTIKVTYPGKNVTVSLTGDNIIHFDILSLYLTERQVNLEISGLEASWYTLEDLSQSFFLKPFSYGQYRIKLHLPNDCSITAKNYPFQIRLSWMDGIEQKSTEAQGNLVITPDPNVYPLAIHADPRLGGNRIFTAWKTDVPATSKIFYRKMGDPAFTEQLVATDALEHKALLDNLDYFTYYEYKIENGSACNGLTASDTYLVRTGKAVKFKDNVNEFWIDRDYNQHAAITITNSDEVPHTYDLSVINDNKDLSVGFVGSGSLNRTATLAPGASKVVDLVLHAPDAARTRYDLYLKIASDEGTSGSFVDYSQAVVNVRPFVANLDIQPVQTMPGLMKAKYRIHNYGDTLTDIGVSLDAASARVARINPAVHHQRLAQGEFVEFEVEAQSHISGTLTAQSGNYAVSAPVEIGCPTDTSLKTYTIRDVPVVAEVKDWYCTNKPELLLPFDVPRGISHPNLLSAVLEARFSLPMDVSAYDPHTVTFYINDTKVATIEDTVPDGTFRFRFPTSLVNLGADGPAENRLKIVTSGVTEGQYIVVTDFRVLLSVAEMQVDLCVPPITDILPPPPPLPPETVITDIVPAKKFRPGAAVPIKVTLHNNDQPGRDHTGRLVLLLKNNSAHGIVPAAQEEQPVTVPGAGSFTADFSYRIPPDADDIDYTVEAYFENASIAKTTPYRGKKNLFYVRSPLVIIHGIAGSKLKRDQFPVWGTEGNFVDLSAGFQENLIWLDLNDDGTPAYSNVTAYAPIKEVFRSLGVANTFDGLDRLLQSRNYQVHAVGSKDDYNMDSLLLVNGFQEDIFYFVYDWRFSNNLSAEKLHLLIDKIYQANSDRINVVAHSMGGLVLKKLLEDQSDVKEKLKKITFVGTPHLGAPTAFAGLAYGENDFGINGEVYSSLLKNMASVYQLLPSGSYFERQQSTGDLSGYFTENGFRYSLFDHMDIHLKNFFNSSLVQSAAAFHQAVDGLGADKLPADTYAIFGCQRSTLQDLVRNSGQYSSKKDLNGDGTVPMLSARQVAAKRTYAAEYVSHADLPSASGVKDLILALLKGEEDASFSSGAGTVAEDSASICKRGTTTITLGGGGSWGSGGFKVWSCEDPDHCVGSGEFPGGIYLGILGSDYQVSRSGPSIFVPEGAVYTLELDGINPEYLQLKLELMREGGENKTYVFYKLAVPGVCKGVVEFDLKHYLTDPVMRLDCNGDGQYEVTGIQPSYLLGSSATEDFLAPVTTVAVSGNGPINGWYRSAVTLSLGGADEEGGSGLLATQYRIDNGAVFHEYTEPITVSAAGVHTVTYYSIDRNMNREMERSVTFMVDTTPPTVTINPVTSPTSSTSQPISGTREADASITITSPNATIGSISYLTPTTWGVNISGLQPGDNTITATATDSAGNSATVAVNIMITGSAKPGDCDGDGKVTIAEVQSAINMYLGLKPVTGCVDTDGGGSVSIAEVQKVINGYLGL